MAAINLSPPISPFGTDEILFYASPGTIWGELGYGCPNFGVNPTTLNNTIAYLVGVMGANLFSIMHHSDVDSRTPPSINTLLRIHKLVLRARTILTGRQLTPATPRMEPVHSTPAPESFLLFPCPFFKVRNPYLKEWSQLLMNCLGEAMQHTENRIEYEITTTFSGTIGQYIKRVYLRMCTELFGAPFTDANKDDYVLPDTLIAAYDPTKWFTSTELVDTVPPLYLIPTEDDLMVLRNGIPANTIVGLMRYPRGGDPNVVQNPTVGAQGVLGIGYPQGPNINQSGACESGVASVGGVTVLGPPGAQKGGVGSTGSFAPPPGP